MCKRTIEVVGLDTARDAYEVEEFLSGLPNVDAVSADFLSNTIVIEYDDTKLSHERVLDTIEHAGCKPSSRRQSILGKVKTTFGSL